MRITRIRNAFILFAAWQVTAFPHSAWARPEYAAKTTMSCTACHVSPWGGGPRTLYGKIYGSRDFPPAPTSASDLYYADVRGIAYYPTRPTRRSSGLALMEAAASANVPINKESEELRLVGTYNISPLQSGPREIYLRWRPGPDEGRCISYVTVGRFNVPFGLLTDEHRTYTRLQTNSTLNVYETGVALSGDPAPALHYDLAGVNDLQGAGTFTNQDLTWALVLNLRYHPAAWPLFIGFSQNFQYTRTQPMPDATSLYSVISLDRLTRSKLTGSISLEGIVSHDWNGSGVNPSIAPFFMAAPPPNYQSSAAQSRARGYDIQAKYDLGTRWSLIYKYDYLVLNDAFPSDAFQRHGIGFETFLNSNLILDVRVEKALVGRPEIKSSNALAAQDDVFSMLHLWL